MGALKNDYRPYGKEYKGRGYRTYRIFLTSFSSMIKSKWTIIILAFSYLFLFFSVLQIVFGSSVEEMDSYYTFDTTPDAYFEVLPLTEDDLHKEVMLGSTFNLSYTVENIGSSAGKPYFLFIVPNEHWEFQAEFPDVDVEPGEQVQVDISVKIPSSKYEFGLISNPESGMEDPYFDDKADIPRGESIPGIEPIDEPYNKVDFLSDYYFFSNSIIFEDYFSRHTLLLVVPQDFIESMEGDVDPNLNHPAVSSIATLVSINKDDELLYVDVEGGTPDLNYTTSFEIMVEGKTDEPYRRGLRAQDNIFLSVTIKNTGTQPIIINLEALLMPIYDWYWDIQIYPIMDHDENPMGEIDPGEEMEYEMIISAGMYTEKMPYNVLILATDSSGSEYRTSANYHMILEVTDGPKKTTMGEEFFKIFWGGGFHYERFLWLILLTAVCGSGLIANDLKNNSIALYLSRPMTWMEYTFGKFLGLSAVLSTVTIIPAILLFFTKIAFKDESFGYILDNLWVLGGMVFAYVLTIVLFSSFALALSSLTKRGIYAGVGIFAYFIFTPPVSDLMSALFNNDHLKLININLVLKSVLQPLFGIDYDSDVTGFGYHLPLLVFCALILLSWTILYNRFKSKEVAK